MALRQDRVKERRQILGLTQAQLAELVGTNQRKISLMELGKNEPTPTTLAALVKALDTTADYLIGLGDVAGKPAQNVGDLDELEREVVALLRSKAPDRRAAIVEMLRLVK